MNARDRYLLAAEDLIAERGFNGASMRDFAGKAGTSLSNLYNHFDSKAALLMSLLESANQELLDRLEAAEIEQHEDASEQLVAATAAYVTFVVDRQKAALIALSEFRYLEGDLRAEQVLNRDKTEAIFASIIERGVESGTFATPYPADATRAIITMLSHISTWYRRDGRMGPEDLAIIQSRYALALVESVSLSATRKSPNS